MILNGTGIDIYSFEQIMVVIPDEASWGGVSFDCLVCLIFHKYASRLTHLLLFFTGRSVGLSTWTALGI